MTQKITPFMCHDCAIRHVQIERLAELNVIILDLHDEIHQLRGERDRAREVAVSLEQELWEATQ